METKNTKSYDINNLFLVAFLGGVIPTLILGVRNAKWLRISKRTINIFILLGVLIISSKIAIAYFLKRMVLFKKYTMIIKFGYTLSVALLYWFYYKSVQPSYRYHMEHVGVKEPLLKDALIWILLGIGIEVLLFMAVGAVLSIV